MKYRIARYISMFVLLLTVSAFAVITKGNDPDEKMPVQPVGDMTVRFPDSMKVFSFPLVYFNHDRHAKSAGEASESCEQCHSGYPDNESYRIYPADTAADLLTIIDGYHTYCKKCHTRENNGPLFCDDCHDGRGSGDIHPAQNSGGNNMTDAPGIVQILAPGATKKSVIFNHTGHEKQVRDCETCHHKDTGKCSTCHTLEESEKGDNFILANAFHELNSQHSCIGCHETVKTRPQCAICHASMPARASDDSCEVCHSGVITEKEETTGETADDWTSKMPVELYFDYDEGEYSPVAFHHRQMVEITWILIRNSALAEAFHGDEQVLCNYCHHEDVGSDEKRKCSQCHPAEPDFEKPEVPIISDAFHKKCASCHVATGLSNEGDCTPCHKNR